jgi:hypothetical protein
VANPFISSTMVENSKGSKLQIPKLATGQFQFHAPPILTTCLPKILCCVCPYNMKLWSLQKCIHLFHFTEAWNEIGLTVWTWKTRTTSCCVKIYNILFILIIKTTTLRSNITLFTLILPFHLLHGPPTGYFPTTFLHNNAVCNSCLVPPSQHPTSHYPHST